MSILSENIRYLRSQRDCAQQKVADDLMITRARYSKYEEGISEPPIVILKSIAHYFQVSIDLLVSVDLRKVPMKDLLKLEGNRILLPITVDRNGDNLVEIIPHTSKAGYLTGYSDPEFIESLQYMSLPFTGPGTHRAFPIEGDSMPLAGKGAFIVGEYVENLRSLKPKMTCILITRNEGMVYKRIVMVNNDSLLVESDNELYPPYLVSGPEILEVWKFYCNIGFIDDKPGKPETDVIVMFKELKKELKELKSKIK
jgi:transcriptional regulator with XRE-family HTH domain